MKGEKLTAEAGQGGRRGMSRVKRALLLIAGVVATILAVIGIAIPVLPTTPLLLLAAACFMRSSDRMYRWLLGNRWFGPTIRSYRELRAVPRRTKIWALIVLWAGIGVSLAVVDSWWVRALLMVILLLVTRHVARLRTIESLDQGVTPTVSMPTPASIPQD